MGSKKLAMARLLLLVLCCTTLAVYGLEQLGDRETNNSDYEYPDVPDCICTNPCTYPFIDLNGQCVTVIRTYGSWTTQREECKKLGDNVDLLEVREKTLPLLKRYMNEYDEILGISSYVWIGGHRNNETTFIWPSGQNVSLSWGWYNGEPNNYSGAEDCMLMFIEEGEFNDEECDYSISALCEKII